MTAVVSTPKPRFLIQFSGQGMKYMDELRRAWQLHPAVRSFIDEASSVFLRELATYDDSETGFFVQGLDVRDWLENPESTPELGYLSSSPISHPLVYLTQIANYLCLLEEGLDQHTLVRHTEAVTGFSTGVMAAVLVAMDLQPAELRRRALQLAAMFFWQGVRCQASLLKAGVHPRLTPEDLASAQGAGSCMASISDVLRSRLDRHIEAFAEHGSVYLAYKVTPVRCIVAGLPEDVAAFGRFLTARGEAHSFRWIPSTIAAHSPYLQHAFDTTPADAKRLGFDVRGSDLKLPVLSNDGGRDLRHSQDLVSDIMHAYFLETGFWRMQIAPLFSDAGITHVLAFGPGSGMAGLTEVHAARTSVEVVRCGLPFARTKLLAEVGIGDRGVIGGR